MNCPDMIRKMMAALREFYRRACREDPGCGRCGVCHHVCTLLRENRPGKATAQED